MEREKGQDVATMSCPNCGAETELVAQPDGALAQAPCPNCYGDQPEGQRATAAEEPVKMKREKTTNVAAQPNQEEVQ